MNSSLLNHNPLRALRPHLPVIATGAFLLSLSLFWFNACDSRVYLALALLATACGCIIVFFTCNNHLNASTSSTTIFAGVLCLLALVYTFAFPPLTVPDEAHHFYSSYWLADVITGQADERGFEVRTSNWQLFTELNNNAVDVDDYHKIMNDFEFFQSDQSAITVDYFRYSLGSENPPTKIATTISILLGKLLNLGTYPLFYLGRLFNAASFIICAIASYRIIPFGKKVIVALSLLPMTLHLAASYSYDVGIISLGMLFTSLTLKAIAERGPLNRSLALSIIAAGTLLAPCKVIYSTLLLLVLFIPSSRFDSRRNSLLFKASVFILPLLMVFALQMTSISNIASTSQTLDVRGDETGHFYELSYAFQQPLATVAIFFRSLIVQGDFYWSTLLGRSLGWFQANIAVPYFYCIPLLFGIAYAAQRDKTDGHVLSRPLQLIMVLIPMASLAACMLSMFIGHTFNTEAVIQGVQGRYLLPVVAPLFLAFRSKHVRIEQDSFPTVITLFSLTNIVILMHIIASAIM